MAQTAEHENGPNPGFDADLLVVGGGVIGAAVALAAAREGLTSLVVDPTPVETALSPGFDGRAYAIALASRRMLTSLGVWDGIAPEAQEIRDILVSDGAPGRRAAPLFLHFDSAEMAEGFGHMVEDHHLRVAVLRAALGSDAIAYRSGVAAAGVERGVFGVRATLSDGATVRARVAVACDGRGSRVAAEAGIDRDVWRYDQVGLVCAVAHEKPHHGVAHEFFQPSGPFAILPLRGDRSALVWTERSAFADALGAVDDATYLAEVRRRFGGFLGRLSLEGARWRYPLSLSVARRFAADRLALAGDAARGIHPIAGQGLNYGLRDAAALAEVLGAAQRRGEDIGAGDVLSRYEAWRRPDSVAIGAATHALNLLFSNDIAPVRAARRLGIAAFGRIGPLRRAAMRFAAGDRADLPSIMRA